MVEGSEYKLEEKDDRSSSIGIQLGLSGADTVVSALSADDSLFRRSGRLGLSGTEKQSGMVWNRQNQLFGRHEESRCLLDAFHRVCAADASSETVLVYGQSGTGKSSLVETLRDRVVFVDKETNDDCCHHPGGYFVSGKFDQLCKRDPFSAIVAAVTDLCDLIAQSEDFDEDRMDEIRQVVGLSDAKMLARVFSNIHSVMGVEAEPMDRGLFNQSNFAQFKLSCRRLLRALSSPSYPVVIFLDDLHWADQSSLELVQSLISDPESKNVLFVCAYRDNDESSDSVERTFLVCPEDHSKELKATITRVQVMNLGLEAVHELVARMLSLEICPETCDLSEIVLQKTHGNPFFSVQFLLQLHAEGYVESDEEGKWSWDMNRIIAETNVSENVLQVVASRIQRIHPHVQAILKLAACFGFEFEKDLLVDVSRPESDELTGEYENKVSSYLAEALHAGLIEDSASLGRYKFSHDNLQQCLYNLIPEEERSKIHCSIGKHYLHRLHEKEIEDRPDWVLFGAADQLNRGVSCLEGNDALVELARINLQAAMVARSKSAFTAAAEFLRNGLGLVDEAYLWEEHYPLALELATTCAETEFSIGNVELAKNMVYQVQSHARRAEDKISVSRTLAGCLMTQTKFSEAMLDVQGLLSEFGVKFPKQPGAFTALWEILKTRRVLRGLTDEDILNIPDIVDTDKLNSMKLMYIIASISPLSDNKLHVLIADLRIVQISIKFGMTPIAAPGFASFAMAQSMFGKRSESYRYGMVALKILERYGNPSEFYAHTVSVVHCACCHWRHPIRDSIEPLVNTYKEGLAAGELRFSFLAAQFFLVCSFHAGKPLPQIESDARSHMQALDEISTDSDFKYLAVPVWQMVLNFMGMAAFDPVELTGTAMHEETVLREAANLHFNGGTLMVKECRLPLAYHFGSLDVAEKTVSELEKEELFLSWFIGVYDLKMYYALVAYALAKKTGKWKYRRKGNRVLRKLESWMATGAVNCSTTVSLLRAEQKSFRAGLSEVLPDFVDAISRAADNKLLHVEALANELAVAACLVHDDLVQALSFLDRALELYEQWGAYSKLEYLTTKYQHIREKNTPSVTMTSVDDASRPSTARSSNP